MPSAGARHVSLTTARCVSIVLAFVLAVVAGVFAPVEGAAKLGPGGPLPLAFEPNQGHADPSVKFLTCGRGYGVFLTPTEAVLVLAPGAGRPALAARPIPNRGTRPAVPEAHDGSLCRTRKAPRHRRRQWLMCR